MLRFGLAVLILALAVGSGLPSSAAGGEPDPALVARAKAGHAEAAYRLGCFYDRAATVAEDLRDAVHWYGFAAKYGHIPALIDLGTMRLRGEGVVKDVESALNHFVQAATSGSVEAAYIIGFIRDQPGALGISDAPFGTPAKEVAALWYRRAAEEGLPDAQWALAWLLSQGEGVPRDMDAAVQFAARSAEGGFPQAQYNMAELYRLGEHGVEVSPQRAAELHRKAAEQGYDQSQMLLAHMYLAGEGVPRDGAKAAFWFRRSMELRGPLSEAEYQLGRLYLDGNGVAKDKVEAFYWFVRAAGAAHEAAIAERDTLSKALPRSVAARVRKRARDDIRGQLPSYFPTEEAYDLTARWALPLAWIFNIYGAPAHLCGRPDSTTPVRPYPVVPDGLLPEN